MATGTQLGYDPSGYYVCQTPGGFSVHLSLQVVRALTAKVSASGETRGILLGRSITTPFAATMVDDFVLIAPSQDFAGARKAVEDTRRELRIVGYLRSQSDGRLRLGRGDVQNFERLFCEEGNVGLLVRAPRRGHYEAALFHWQDGQLQPREFGFGFPFDDAKLAGGHPGWRFPDPLESEEEDPVASVIPKTPESRAGSSAEGVRWLRLLPTVVLVCMGIVATQFAWNSRGTASADSSHAEAITPATARAYETALGLKVNAQPHQLEIRWNRAAPVVATAQKGAMSITDAGATEVVPFDATELREGYVAYTPKTNDVGIRFEVTGADGAATRESIRVVAIP